MTAFDSGFPPPVTTVIAEGSPFVLDGGGETVLSNSHTIQPGPFLNGGDVIVEPGRTVTRAGAWNQTGGSTRVDGMIVLSDGASMQLQGGILSGSGSVSGGLVDNSAGTVAPGASTGVLTIGTGYSQGGGGTLAVEVGGTAPGTQHDVLAVVGDASIAGTLRVSLADGFAPAPGDEFTILTTTGTRTGKFDLIESCDDVDVLYGPNSVTVAIMPSSGVAGDLNGDGEVDGADLGGLLAAWGPCGSGCCEADLTGDGMVDGGDLGLLLAAWSTGP